MSEGLKNSTKARKALDRPFDRAVLAKAAGVVEETAQLGEAPAVSQPGRYAFLTVAQARRLREWAALGTSIKTAALTLGVPPRTAQRYLAGQLKKLQHG